MPARPMLHEVDARDEHLEKIGDMTDVEVFHNQVLCMIYRRPEKTKSGIILPDANRDEDKYQGKVGLIVKVGPNAFKDPNGSWQWPEDIGVGDWVWYRTSDAWPMAINEQECRLVEDVDIKGRIQHPDVVW